MKLILASQSAARAQLMMAAGYRFEQIPSGVEETLFQTGGIFRRWLASLARQKAWAVARKHPRAFVIGADTAVYFRKQVIGKATDRAHAAQIIRQLSGNPHQLSTAVCVVAPASHGTRRIVESIDSARVTFRKLTSEQILTYIEKTDPMHCAGAYALQGGGTVIIRKISGDPTTIVGLPMALLDTLLTQSGYH